MANDTKKASSNPFAIGWKFAFIGLFNCLNQKSFKKMKKHDFRLEIPEEIWKIIENDVQELTGRKLSDTVYKDREVEINGESKVYLDGKRGFVQRKKDTADVKTVLYDGEDPLYFTIRQYLLSAVMVGLNIRHEEKEIDGEMVSTFKRLGTFETMTKKDTRRDFEKLTGLTVKINERNRVPKPKK